MTKKRIRVARRARKGIWVSLHALVALSLMLQTTLVTGTFSPSRAQATEVTDVPTEPAGGEPVAPQIAEGVAVGSISGTVYHDHNGNGVRDGEDEGLPNIHLQLTNGLGDDTDADGNYTIENVPAGIYPVLEFTPAGWVTTVPYDNAVFDVVVESGQDTKDVNFGNFRKTYLHGAKYHDLNADGVWDVGEPGLPNWQFQLWKFDQWYFDHQAGENQGYLMVDEEVATTDANGRFTFSGITPGAYRVTEVTQAGWDITSPASEMYTDLHPRSDEKIAELDFGNKMIDEKPSITVNKEVDVNGNGVWNEPADGGNTKGNALGFRWGYEYELPDTASVLGGPNLLFGTTINEDKSVTIVENDVAKYRYVGWHYTSNDRYTCASPREGWPKVQAEGPIEITLCNALITGAIDGYVWNDRNGDGIWQDGTEPAIPNRYVQSVHGLNDTTDATGYFKITGIPVGTETAIPFTPAGWINTNQSAMFDIVVTDSPTPTRVNFGTFHKTSISGMKFADTNASGTKDSGEAGLADWTVTLWQFDAYYFNHPELYGVNDGYLPIDTTTTAANGTYTFADLGPGMYKVSEVQQSGWTQTYPAGTGMHGPLQLLSGEAVINQDFGNFSAPAVVVPSRTTLDITKTNNISAFVNPGQTVSYTVTVTNTGSADATNVIVNDTLPSGFLFSQDAGQKKVFPIGLIPAGQTRTLVYSASVGLGVANGTYTNTAIVSSDTANVASATSSVEVRTSGVLGVSTGSLKVSKTAAIGIVNPNGTISYTVTVTNSGTEPLVNLVVTDTLPEGFVFADGQAEKQWVIATLAGNTTKSFTYDVHVPATASAGTMTNNVVALANDIDPARASADVEIRIPEVLGLAATGLTLNDQLIYTSGLIIAAVGFGLLRKKDEETA